MIHVMSEVTLTLNRVKTTNRANAKKKVIISMKLKKDDTHALKTVQNEKVKKSVLNELILLNLYSLTNYVFEMKRNISTIKLNRSAYLEIQSARYEKIMRNIALFEIT
jgi:hypothetical protein